MGVWSHLKDFLIEVIGLAIFIISTYKIIIVLFTDSLSKVLYYSVAILLGLFLMSYKNIPHNIKKATRK